MFPSEFVCHTSEHTFVIMEYFIINHHEPSHVILIFDEDLRKFNLYLISVKILKFPFYAKDIVHIFHYLPIESAQRAFPLYDITENSYGF